MAKVEETIKIKVVPEIKMTLWQAVKIRISGIYKNLEHIEQIGDVLKVTYREQSKQHNT